MQKKRIISITSILFAVALLGAGCGTNTPSGTVASIADDNGTAVRDESNAPIAEPEPERVDFSQYNPVFRFSADVPAGFAVEYVPQIESINIYDPDAAGDAAVKQSQIFIRYFEASSFLTLQTVDILNREETSVRGHGAVRYEIAKKAGVADFPHQPSWRNAQHKLTDVRFSPSNPTLFYVFSYNPNYPSESFEQFLQSVVFHNDKASFSSAVDGASARITKKPFGIRITAEHSPVQPERFSGFHTGADYETFASEQGADVPVYAICGGELVSARAASGYGGVLVQACEYEGQSIRVIYGHTSIGSVNHAVGGYFSPGEQIALLGEQGLDTDGERKHLHLGIRKGTSADIRGYVASEADLSGWMDPESLPVTAGE